jgi:hypothetical protein
MNRLRNIGFAGVLFALLVAFEFAPVARAEEFSNLGVLLDKGGAPVASDALRTLLTGATFGGQSINNTSEFEVHYTGDGKYTGTWWAGGAFGRVWGTWTLRDDSALCTAGESDWRPGVTKLCTFWYKHGENYYSAASNDRSAYLRMRRVKR